MNFSKLLIGSAVLLNSISLSLGDCDGCSGASCVKLNDNVYGCYGTFSSGTISDEANNLCSADYHICRSANEANVLGLTQQICGNNVPNGHTFWTIESSNGNNECYSDYGSINDDTPSTDVWGCTSYSTYIPGCNTNTAVCGDTLNIQCGDTSQDFTPYGFNICDGSGSCEGTQLFTIESTDATKSGSLCCTDDLGFNNIEFTNEQCDETIYVREIYKPSNLALNYEPYVGKYEFEGIDPVTGYYTYKHNGVSGTSYFSITSYLNYNYLISFVLSDVPASYWGPIESSQLELQNNIWQMTGDEDEHPFTGEELQWSTRGPWIIMSAVFNDCTWGGLNKPSDIICPDYNSDAYNCLNDENCDNCQSWGCVTCTPGTYKMGMDQKCQNCTYNYPNCDTCTDWQGCTTCDAGYKITWENSCNDQVCIENV